MKTEDTIKFILAVTKVEHARELAKIVEYPENEKSIIAEFITALDKQIRYLQNELSYLSCGQYLTFDDPGTRAMHGTGKNMDEFIRRKNLAFALEELKKYRDKLWKIVNEKFEEAQDIYFGGDGK